MIQTQPTSPLESGQSRIIRTLPLGGVRNMMIHPPDGPDWMDAPESRWRP
jgi:hypothetical protein